MEDLKFTREIKENWLAALKSGEYIQGEGRLRQIDQKGVCRYCCLGVLDVVCGFDNIAANGMSVKNGYGVYKKLLGETATRHLYITNDSECDGKYTSVIPLIEAIPTTD